MFDKFVKNNAAIEKMNDLLTQALAQTKLNELFHKNEQPVEPPKKKMKAWVIVLIVFAAVIAVAAIAYGVYKYMNPDYLEDFDDEDLELEDDDEDEEEDTEE